MNLAISNIALWMLISLEFAYCASLKDADRKIVKRDLDIIPAVMSGAVDTTLDLLDKFGKGFAVRGGSKFDAFGLHDEKNFEAGTIDTSMSQAREKRAALPCGRKNETLPMNGTSPTVNRRNANNPDVETLARRKRSAQSNENPANGSPPNGSPPNGSPPNCPPPNGPPPSGPPPNGPPLNGRPPNGPPPNNSQRPGDGASQNGAQTSGQLEEQREPVNLVREKRTPCNNATEVRSKRSAPEISNEDSQPILPQETLVREKRTPCNNATEVRSKRSVPEKSNEDSQPILPQETLVREKRTPCNNATEVRSKRSVPEKSNEDSQPILPRETLVREKRTPCNNATEVRSKRSVPEKSNEDSQPILPQETLVREKRTPCNNATEVRSKRSVPERSNEDSQPILPQETLVREKRTPCNNATEVRSKRSPQRSNDPSQQNEVRRQLERDNKDKDGNGQGQNLQNENKNLNGYGGRNDNPTDRVKRSAKPCNGQNGQPIGVPTNNIPQQQLPPQQQQQQPQPAGVNIGDLQRDQNQRTKRQVNDPDKVVPGSNMDDKNLFERIIQVTKEVFSRVARWVDDMDKEMANSKVSSDKPK